MKKLFFGIFLTLLSLSIVRYFFTDDNGGVSILTVLDSLQTFGSSVLNHLLDWQYIFESFENISASSNWTDSLQNIGIFILQILYLPFEILFRVVYIIVDVWNLLAGLVGLEPIPPFEVPNPIPSGPRPDPAGFGGGGGGAR